METHTVGSIGSNVQFIPFRSGASRVLVPRQELEPLVKGEEVVVFWGKVLSDLPVIGRRFSMVVLVKSRGVVGLSRKWWEAM